MKILCVHETPFHVRSGKAVLTSRVLQACGPCEFEFVSVVHENGVKITPNDWHTFHAEYLANVGRFDKVLCLGGIATAGVFDTQKAPPITKIRGLGCWAPGDKFCVPTYSPTTIFKDPDLFRDFGDDIWKVVNHTEPKPDLDLEVQVASTYLEAKRALNELRSATFVSCDLETTGFSPIDDTIVSTAFAALHVDGSAHSLVIPWWVMSRDYLKRFLEEYPGRIVFHNLKFDYQHLLAYLGRFRMKAPSDTMLLHYALDERPANRYAVHGLKLLARTWYDAPNYEVDMKTFLPEFAAYVAQEKVEGRDGRDFPQLKELFEYQARDTAYTAMLYEDLTRECEEESEKLLSLVYDVLVPATEAFSEIELKGTPINRRYFEHMREDVTRILEDDLERMRGNVFRLAGTRHINNSKEEFNPNSPKQVEILLYDELECPVLKDAGRNAHKRKKDARPTEKDVLKALARHAQVNPEVSELIKDILGYRQKAKILGTYVEGILKRIRSDGRVSSDFFIPGTATGRISSGNPNLQNIPDASHVGYDIREGIAAQKGWELIEADYSQLELRVAAQFSQDPHLLRTFREDKDIHQEVAFALWGKPKDEVTKYERYLAKCLNFGVLYGRGALSIATGPEMDHLEEMGGNKWNAKDIEGYFNKFLASVPGFVAWIEKQKKFARENHYVENPFGHRRRFPFTTSNDSGHMGRQAVNTPIQGFASHLCLTAMTRIHYRLDPQWAHVCFPVHDSILVHVRKDKVREVAEIIIEEMEHNLPPVIDYSIPFKADAAYGSTWGQCKRDPLAVPYTPVEV